MQADGPKDNPGRGGRRSASSCLTGDDGPMAWEEQGGDWRGACSSRWVLSLAAEQALGWPSRISTRDRAKVLGLRLFWMPDQDTHNPPTESGFVYVLFSH